MESSRVKPIIDIHISYLLVACEDLDKNKLITLIIKNTNVCSYIHEESKPIWDYGICKFLYVSGLIYQINPKAFT